MGSLASKETDVGVVSELNVYPLKSGRGQSVQEAEIVNSGLRGDREFVLVDETNNFTSQRKIPAMAKVELRREGQEVVVLCDGEEKIRDELVTDESTETLTVWGSEIQGILQSEKLSKGICTLLNVENLKLFWARDDLNRDVEKGYAKGDNHQVKYSDGYPFLLTTTKSLADLNSRLNEPVPMNRFRPNIVVDGPEEPWAEDKWSLIRINGVTYQCCKPCARCKVPSVDQATGVRSSMDPTKPLLSFHAKDAHNPLFGMNLVHNQKSGSIRVGDTVTLIS